MVGAPSRQCNRRGDAERDRVLEGRRPAVAQGGSAGHSERVLRHSTLLSDVPGLVHGFSTRAGPAWVDPTVGLDLGPDTEVRTWAWLAAQVGLPRAAIARLSQVHGALVHEAEGPGVVGEGDAVRSSCRGLLLTVRVADCVPVLVAELGVDGTPVQVAAIHAGWRGLAAGVIPQTLAAMGAARGRRLAVVGPCIGVEAYEVGAEVIDGIGARVPRGVFVQPGRRPGHWQADLRSAAAWQLTEGGVDEVDVVPWCTWTDSELHSYRRDGAKAGRLGAVIGIRP